MSVDNALTEKPRLSDALNNAVEQIEEILKDKDPRAAVLLSGLKDAAQIEALEGIEAPIGLTLALTSTDPENVRRGAAFLTRPNWIVGRDLFSFDPAGVSQEGWHVPLSLIHI